MNSSRTFDVVDPQSDDAVWAMTQYFDELDRRFPGGFDPGDTLTADAGGLREPQGVFVVVHDGEPVVGCGGVQTIGVGIGEVKRMWVSSSHRGQGIGAALLGELERHSARLGHHTIRLDTNDNLGEALAMYLRHGYVEIDRYNDNPYPTHFFEKALRDPPA